MSLCANISTLECVLSLTANLVDNIALKIKHKKEKKY